MASSQPAFPVTNGHTHPHTPASSYPPSIVPTTNGSPHGSHDHVGEENYGVAGPSSSSSNGYGSAEYPLSHNEQIINHLYNTGFQLGEYADTLLHIRQNRYKLHAIILSRSPYLAHLISTSPKSGGMHTIYVPLESIPEITEEGFVIAMGYLYSSTSLNNLTPSNSRTVLAAGCLLGGMDDLCNYAYQACRESITVETINEYIDFVDGLPSSDGTLTPSEVQRPTVLGPYSSQLRNDVFQFLVVTLPSMLDVQSSTSGRETLVRIFSRLPFDLFKSAVESPMFQLGSDQERFRFAKAVIDLRKRTRGGGVEETVVLAFGGGHSGSAVHVTRKTKKRALFKISRNQGEVVAVFDWTTTNYLGLATVMHRPPFPMATLALPGSSTSARAFFLDRAKFEWRKVREDPCSYDLYDPQNIPIASFRQVEQSTPVGPSHGILQYSFVQPPLLLESLLALCVNRWLDLHDSM